MGDLESKSLARTVDCRSNGAFLTPPIKVGDLTIASFLCFMHVGVASMSQTSCGPHMGLEFYKIMETRIYRLIDIQKSY